MNRRLFTRSQRIALYVAAGGRCEECGAVLARGWHADHVVPWSHGGRTDIGNGRALCAACNLRKGARMGDLKLRYHQEEIVRVGVERVQEGDRNPVVALLPPGFGKQLAWQALAAALFRGNLIDTVAAFTPRVSLSSAAEKDWCGIKKRPGQPPREVGYRLKFGPPPPPRFKHASNRAPLYEPPARGYISTYQSLTANPSLHALHAAQHSGRLLLVVDEAAMLGGYGLGERDEREATKAATAIERLYPYAVGVLYLTGTPYRYDGRRLILLNDRYLLRPDGRYELDADVKATYTEGVASEILRACEVTYFNAEGTEVLPDGSKRAVSVESSPETVTAMLETPRVYKAMVRRTIDRLRIVRKHNKGFVAGIACMNAEHARACHAEAQAYGREFGNEITLSDDPASQDVLARAREGKVDVLTFVRQAFIGFDCPQMAVLGILTNYRDQGFLMQLAGRALRIWKLVPPGGQRAHFITLNDPKSVEFFENLRSDADAGLALREPGCGPGSSDRPGREYEDLHVTDTRVEDPEGEVEDAERAYSFMDRYGFSAPPRVVLRFLNDLDQAGRFSTADNGHDDDPPVTTSEQRIKDLKSHKAKVLKKIAAKRLRDQDNPFNGNGNGNGAAYADMMKQVHVDFARRGGGYSDDARTEEEAREQDERAMAMAMAEGVDVSR
jgi:superfamily II DNA or RNA helicase